MHNDLEASARHAARNILGECLVKGREALNAIAQEAGLNNDNNQVMGLEGQELLGRILYGVVQDRQKLENAAISTLCQTMVGNYLAEKRGEVLTDPNEDRGLPPPGLSEADFEPDEDDGDVIEDEAK